MASIFGCGTPCTPDSTTTKVYLDQVKCFADLTLSVPFGVTAGTRYIVKNANNPFLIHPTWINLPLGMEDNDIIQKDFQNLNWTLATNVSVVGAGQFTYVECKGYYYWWDGVKWNEISPTNFCGLCEIDEYIPTLNQTVFTLHIAPVNPDKSILSVNQAIMQYGIDYVINSATLTWINPSYTLDPGDFLQIRYS